MPSSAKVTGVSSRASGVPPATCGAASAALVDGFSPAISSRLFASLVGLRLLAGALRLLGFLDNRRGLYNRFCDGLSRLRGRFDDLGGLLRCLLPGAPGLALCGDCLDGVLFRGRGSLATGSSVFFLRVRFGAAASCRLGRWRNRHRRSTPE